MTKIKSRAEYLFLLIFSITSKVSISLIGKILLSEIISLVLFPFTGFRTFLKGHKGILFLSLCFFSLLLSQIISDLINNSSANDYLRGWASIAFSFFSFITLIRIIKIENDGLLFYLISLVLVNLIFGKGELDTSLIESDTNYFKVRYTGFLNPLILLISYFLYKKYHYLLTISFFFFVCLIYFYFDARSNGLFYLFSCVILYFKHTKVSYDLRLLILLIVLIFVFIFYVLYVYFVLNHGFGGKNAYSQLTHSPNPYNPLWLIFYGRTEVVVLFRAIADSPIFGHGSWGKDSTGVYALLTAKLTGAKQVVFHPYINAHSVIFGYWSYAGLGGFISIILIYYKLIKMYLKVLNSRFTSLYLPIITYFFCELNWMMFFSPIGEMRVSFPLISAIILLSYNYMNYLELENAE